ncbi:transposase [Candidatus Bipolaricaulota bacterium]|nr:transposase [Candidatus Bipolaricaulota bacterium]
MLPFLHPFIHLIDQLIEPVCILGLFWLHLWFPLWSRHHDHLLITFYPGPASLAPLHNFRAYPLERLLREAGRRCDVVGLFPHRRVALQLIGAVLIEQQDEREVGRRYLSADSMPVLYEGREENS